MMVNWQQNILSRVMKEIKESEIRSANIDFTKDRDIINAVFDELCEPIEKLKYEEKIQLDKIKGNDECLRVFKAFDGKYKLCINENEIKIKYSYGDDFNGQQSYKIIVKDGEKHYQYLNFDGTGEKVTATDKLATLEFDYKEILNNLMDTAFMKINSYEYNKLHNTLI